MWYAILFIALLIAAAVWFFWLRKGKNLSASAKAELRGKWQRTQAIGDPHRRLLEADAVVSQVLGMRGYAGTMADRLKKAGPYIPDVNGVWAAHKLRNRIAHEPGLQVSDAEAARAMKAFGRVIEKFSS